MQWQTEEETPIILNQALRSKQKSKCIKDIKKSDDVYQSGLKHLRTTMEKN